MEHIETVGNKLFSPELMDVLSLELKQNVADIVYKRIIGEEKKVQLGNNSYTLLPIGNINKSLEKLLDKTIRHPARGTRSISGGTRILTSKLEPITIEGASLESIMNSYRNHYLNALGENWSEKDFKERLDSLKYCTYKYARDDQSGRVFVVGFFGAQIANGAGGKYLTNAELYVLPHFRGRGIAKELVKQSFELALEDGISGFDSLTYKIPDYNPLQFWRNIGANNTELYHIEGSISEIIDNINNLEHTSKIKDKGNARDED